LANITSNLTTSSSSRDACYAQGHNLIQAMQGTASVTKQCQIYTLHVERHGTNLVQRNTLACAMRTAATAAGLQLQMGQAAPQRNAAPTKLQHMCI
jgi:hypothetical protein